MADEQDFVLWHDEFSDFPYPGAIDKEKFGFRLGSNPQVAIQTRDYAGNESPLHIIFREISEGRALRE